MSVIDTVAVLHMPRALNLLLRGLQDYIADHGKGSYIWTSDGQKHLDMGAGARPILLFGPLLTSYDLVRQAQVCKVCRHRRRLDGTQSPKSCQGHPGPGSKNYPPAAEHLSSTPAYGMPSPLRSARPIQPLLQGLPSEISEDITLSQTYSTEMQGIV